GGDGHLLLQGRRRRGQPPQGGDHRRLQAGGLRRAAHPRPRRPDAAGEGDRPQRRDLVRQAHQGDRADGDDPPAVDHGLLGHDAAARVLRARGSAREQASARDDRQCARGHRIRPDAVRRARAAPEDLQPALHRDGARGGDRRRPRGGARPHGRPAREGRLAAPPGQGGDDVPGCRAVVRAARAGGPADLHRPGLRRHLRGVRRRASADHQVHRRALRHAQELLVRLDRRRHRAVLRLPPLAQVDLGPPAVGPRAPEDPLQDRRHRPEDRARALVADDVGALLGRRAHPARHRGDRPDRRQCGHRGRHGGGHRVRQVRWHAGGAPQGRADLPLDGGPDDRGRRGDRRPRQHADQGRRLLRGRGRRGDQGPHLDPRAGDDRVRRRHRRLHRRGDVHADVQGLRHDPV
ncbi:MAG: Type IV fimbrial assembly protein PilC, partial [uncultured Solirubrobacteraceae bacterium]